MEHNLSSAPTLIIGIGIGSGAGVFFLMFFGIGFLDMYLKRRAEKKYKARLELEKRLKKQKKAQAMAQMFVNRASISVSSASGGTDPNKLDVPSLSLRTSISSTASAGEKAKNG